MICIIVCFSQNRVIGNKGKIPWKFPADLQHFKQVTTGNTVVMGRKTFESVGILPNRKTVVLTNSIVSAYYKDDVLWVPDTQEVLSLKGDVFIAGGEQVYYDFLHLADYMMLTMIHQNIEGDTYFPTFDASKWDVVEARRGNKHSYVELERV